MFNEYTYIHSTAVENQVKNLFFFELTFFASDVPNDGGSWQLFLSQVKGRLSFIWVEKVTNRRVYFQTREKEKKYLINVLKRGR